MEAIRSGFLPTIPVTGETALLHAAQRGDQRAFEALLQTHVAPLRRFLQRRLPADAVEDVLQEALLAAWAALPGFQPQVRFKTWLYRIALYKRVDWQRLSYRDAALLSLLPAPTGSLLPAPTGTLNAVEDSLTVRAFLDQLSEDQRLILELYYFDDLTLAEVALVLDRNLNTVKYHFYQAHASGLRFLQDRQEECPP